MRLSLIALAACLATPAFAQDPVFDSYDAMRAEMDDLLMRRDIQPLMLRFGGGDEMTRPQLDQLDAQVEQLYPQDFENAAVIAPLSPAAAFISGSSLRIDGGTLGAHREWPLAPHDPIAEFDGFHRRQRPTLFDEA